LLLGLWTVTTSPLGVRPSSLLISSWPLTVAEPVQIDVVLAGTVEVVGALLAVVLIRFSFSSLSFHGWRFLSLTTNIVLQVWYINDVILAELP
jgi:hypothetical protein